MLEHAGSYDPVERAGDGSIVFLLKGGRSRRAQLLLRQADSAHICAALARLVKGKAGPATADVEHAMAGSQSQQELVLARTIRQHIREDLGNGRSRLGNARDEANGHRACVDVGHEEHRQQALHLLA